MEWVTDEVRMRMARSTGSAERYNTVRVAPGWMSAGACAMTGRGPQLRYGGVKISAVVSQVTSEPATATRQSGKSMATEW